MIIQNIVFDNELPVLSISKPTSNSFINSPPNNNFNISEDLDESTLVLEQIAGENDPGSPHILKLSDEKRKMGSLDDEVFDAFEWVDGATYKLSFNGIDFAKHIKRKF